MMFSRKDQVSLSLRLAPWLAVIAMAAFWPRGKTHGPDAAAPACSTPHQFDAAEPGRGRDANTPWAIPSRGWKDILWRTWREMGRDRLAALAGSVTFYLLLATFPALAAFVSVYGLFLDVAAVERQLHQLSAVFPSDVVNLIGDQMVRLASQKHEALGAAFAASTLVSVWSANAGMKALFDGLNVTYDETEKRPYLQRTLITYGATLGALLFLAAVVAMTLAAPILLGAVGLHELKSWWTPLRWLLVYLLAAGAFTLVYRVGPSRRQARWPWLIVGGVTAALAWMAGSLGFNWYVANFTHFGVTYGSLGAMIGFMLWVWFSLMVVLTGAELNAEIEHQTAHDTTVGAPEPLGQRGAVMADTVGKAFTVSPREAGGMAVAFASRQVGYVVGFMRRLARV